MKTSFTIFIVAFVLGFAYMLNYPQNLGEQFGAGLILLIINLPLIVIPALIIANIFFVKLIRKNKLNKLDIIAIIITPILTTIWFVYFLKLVNVE